MNQTQAPKVTLVPARPTISAGRESVLDVLIKIEPPPFPRSEPRRPLSLDIVLDRSGSMEGDKIAHAKEAVAFAVSNMASDDLVSLTIYDNRVETIVARAPVAAVRAEILAALKGIGPCGSTALHDAWVRGGLEVSERMEARCLNRVLLISDGLANVGETNPDTIVSRVGELFSRGVGTSTIGVGADFNEDLMIPMAVAGGGNGWFVERPVDFRRIFDTELSGLASLFAEKGTLRVEPRRAGTALVEVLNDFPYDGESWMLGALNHGQPLEIVARIRARGGEVGQPLDLLDVRLGWEVPRQGRIEPQQLLRIPCDDPARVEASPTDPEVERAVSLLMAARARREAVRAMDAGDLRAAMGLVEGASLRQQMRFASSADQDALVDSHELDRLLALLKDEQDPAAARGLARKLASYQAYHRSSRSRRQP